MSLAESLIPLQQRVEENLIAQLQSRNNIPDTLRDAMLYSVTGGGKRIRPALVYATSHCLNMELTHVDAIACAVELIHCYSLVHDDLPAMDNDDLRRGRATCHIAFDEATAILVGDALQSLAFETIATSAVLNAEQKLAIVACLAKACGCQGMVAGQVIDLQSENANISLQQLQLLHRAKTGALIQACIDMVLIASPNATKNQQQALQCYAKNIGLAFQVQDDVLDIISDTETLGKQQGSDVINQKTTYVSLLGLPRAQQKAQSLIDGALTALQDFDSHADLLRQLANYVVKRDH